MNLFDTLSGKKKELKTQKKQLRLFVCGPTVYDYSHIGHARTYVAFDMLVKYMRSRGHDIYYLQNITDINDKILDRAKEQESTEPKIAKEYEKAYYEDMEKLGIDSVDKYARASDYTPGIIEQIKMLLEKGFAYKTENGVYFRVRKFKDYGNLSRQKVDKVYDAVSIEEDPQKENPEDFALWKLPKENENVPVWDSPWGKGRPGWHIEDTAITYKEFGEAQYELHGGARDLIFPHHEAEIAQMEAAFGKKPFVQWWLHTGFLQMSGEKMSKSLKNFVTIRDVLKEYSPRVLRLFFTTKHYRSPIDYTKDGLDEARSTQKRLREFWIELAEENSEKKIGQQDGKITESIEEFWKELEDDFNTPKAFAQLFSLVTYVYKKEELAEEDRTRLLSFLRAVNSIFGIIDESDLANQKIPENVRKLAEKREKLRKEKKWEEADEIRKEIQEAGYDVKDTDTGPKIIKN